MSNQLSKKSVARNYAFLAIMLGGMVLGAIVGWIWPQEGHPAETGRERQAAGLVPVVGDEQRICPLCAHKAALSR